MCSVARISPCRTFPPDVDDTMLTHRINGKAVEPMLGVPNRSQVTGLRVAGPVSDSWICPLSVTGSDPAAGVGVSSPWRSHSWRCAKARPGSWRCFGSRSSAVGRDEGSQGDVDVRALTHGLDRVPLSPVPDPTGYRLDASRCVRRHRARGRRDCPPGPPWSPSRYRPASMIPITRSHQASSVAQPPRRGSCR
jgi:hypothetical protein